MPSDWICHTDDTRFCREAKTPDSDDQKRDDDGTIDYYHTDDGQKRDNDCTDYYSTGEDKKRGDYCPDYHYTSNNNKRHEARSPDGLGLEELD